MSDASLCPPARGLRGREVLSLKRLVSAILVATLAACATAPPDSAPPPTPPTAQQASDSPAPQPTSAPTVTAAADAAAPSPTSAPDTTLADGQPFVFAIDPLRPTVIVDTEDASARIDLWARIRAGFAMPDLVDERVTKWEQWYATRPEYVQRMTERGSLYLFYVVEEIDKRGMPTELALLPFIESAFNPQALSRARASGMWQFMPGTGKDFDLKQNLFRDDRRDVLASTRAALDYLQMLHEQFGDWQLALAAYNWGQGSVQRALTRNRKADLPLDYTSLRMPDETRNYVPKLQAVKNILRTPQLFAITLPALENHPYFLSVPITRDVDVAVAASLAGLPIEEFQQLNPQMNRPVILAAGTPQVLLPYANATLFVRNLRSHGSPLASWTAWVAPTTLKPADAARMVGMSEDDLRRVNDIPVRMRIKAGSTLLVPRTASRSADVPEHIADNAVIALAPDGPAVRRITFKAGKKGDSVSAVAKRYRVSTAQVADWNSVATSARFAAGEVIVVMQPVARTRTRVSTRTASGKSAVKPTSLTTSKSTRRPSKR
ncbi:MAG: transglycosylase SLT domain-containing protein [Rubrivivax sp.]